MTSHHDSKGPSSGPLAKTFAALAKDGRKALAPFVTAGDPDLDTTLAVLEALDRASVGQQEKLLGGSSAVAFPTNGKELGVEVVAQRGGELFDFTKVNNVLKVDAGSRYLAEMQGHLVEHAAHELAEEHGQ